MKKKTTKLLCCLLVFGLSKLNAQLSGAYSVPGSYASIGAAIADLNTLGVSGAVTINIAAGHTETATVNGYTLNSITGASAANQITFQKSGIGANPIIYAYAGGTATPSSALQDGVWKFVGADYITVDGINITDPNTANPATMEFGFGFFRASATNGCQNNTIKNCVVTLNRVNNAAGSAPAVDGSRGIEVVNALVTAHTTALTITNATGANSNNKFYSNTIQNCNYGISMIGYADSSPYSNADTGNDIGGTSSATGNTIINFGGGGTTSAAAGIRTLAQYAFNIGYNVINNNNGSGVNHGEVLRGIFHNTAAGAVASINNNTISVQSAGTTQLMAGITNVAGGSTGTINVVNNSIVNCTYTTATSALFNAFLNSSTPAVLTFTGNIVNNIKLKSTGTNLLTETGSPTYASVSSNTITNITNAGVSGTTRILKITSPTNLLVTNNLLDGISYTDITSSGSIDGFYGFSSSANMTVTSNTLRNFSIPNAGSINGFREFGTTGNKYFQNNLIYNFTTTSGGSGGASFNGIYLSTGTHSISGNTIYALNSTGTTGGTGGGVVGINIAGGTTSTVYKNKIYDLSTTSTGGGIIGINMNYATNNIVTNNIISNLFTPATAFGNFAIVGIYMGAGTANFTHYNTVNLSGTSTGAQFGATALWGNTTATLDMRNNIFVNNIVPKGTGLAVAYYRTSTTISTYSTSSNNNLFYAGAPSASNLIFWDGTNLIPTLAAFKTFASTRDGLSVTEDPTFISTVGSNPAFLNINTSVPTQIESGALPVSGITDDYAGTVRNATTPDIGAFEGTYVPVPACSGTPVTPLLAGSAAAVCPSVTVNMVSMTSYSNAGISYQWLASTTSSSSGFAAVLNATTAVISNTNLPATTWYQLQVTCANGGASSTSLPYQVVLGPPSFSAVSNVSFACVGQNANLSLSGSAGGLTYQWLASTTASNSGFSAIPGATLSTRTGTTAIAGNIWFQTILACSANPSASLTTNAVNVLYGAVPTASASLASNSICVGGTASLIGGTDVGATYFWRGPNSFTSSLQSPTAGSITSGAYTLVTSLNTCSSIPAYAALHVIGELNPPAPVASPTAICLGSSSTLQTTAQLPTVNRYNFFPSSGSSLITLTTGSTSLLSSSNDDTPMGSPAAIGFTFMFNGVNYTQFTASPDGWVMLGSATGASEYANAVTATNNIPKFYPYWDDMATGTNGYVRSQLLGSAPNRTLVIEWFVTVPRNTTGAANSTFQALLFETSNALEFRYGTMGADAGGLSSCGLTGSSTNYNSVTHLGMSNSIITPNDNNTTQPAPGTSYLFTPPVITYTWAPAGTLSSTSLYTVNATPLSTTVYSINYTADGCPTTRTVQVSVSTPPATTVVASNTAICPGGSATLTGTGATTYSWSTGSTNTVIVVTPTNNAQTYTVLGINGACSETKSITIVTPGNPTVTLSGSSGICTGQTATIIANGASTYSWNTGATTNSITDTPSGNTTYTVTGTDALGCSTTTTQLVTVAGSLSISITGANTICYGESTVLSAQGGVTYLWDGGATTNTLLINPTTNTTYSVVGSSGTCSNSAMVTVTVNTTPTVAVTGGTVICVGKTTTLTANGAATYTWNGTTNASSLAVSPTSNTTYTVIGTNTLNCSDSETVTVISNTVPVVNIAQTSTAVCATSSATLTASGADTYTWNVTGAPTVTNLVVTPLVNTVYTVTGTNAAGCTASKTIAVVSNTLPALVVTPASPTVCVLSTIYLTGAGAVTYTWSNSDHASLTSFTPAANVTYTLSGTSAQGCTTSVLVPVTTNSLPVISITPPSVTVCAQSVTGYSATGAVTYTWNGSNQGANVMLYNPFNTTHTVVGTSPEGCKSSATVSVTTTPLPVLTASPAFTTVCLNSNHVIHVSSQTAVTFTWNGNNSTTGSSVAVTPTAAANQFTVAGTDALGCTATLGVPVLTYPLPVISTSPNTPTICPMKTATFVATGATSYVWSAGTANAGTVVVTPSVNTTYTVFGTDQNGCVGSKTVAVVTKTLPAMSITPSSSICIGSAITLTASGATVFNWSTGDNTSFAVVSPTLNTVYTVTGTVNQTGCSATRTVAVGVHALPVIALSAAPSATLCAKEINTITITGAASYTVQPGNNVNQGTFTISPNNTTTYTAVGLDANGCQNSEKIVVVVDKCTGVKVNSMVSDFINIFPNPSTGKITAEFGFEGVKTISIINSVGALVSTITTESGSESFDLSQMAKGVYFVKIDTKGTSNNYKIIIQ